MGSFTAPDLDDIERSFALALDHARRVAVVSSSISGTSSALPTVRTAWRSDAIACTTMNLEQRVLPAARVSVGRHAVPQ